MITYCFFAILAFIALVAGLMTKHHRNLKPAEVALLIGAALIWPVTLGAVIAIFIGVVFSKILQDIQRF